MRETRKINICNKIFTKEDLKSIHKIFIDAYQGSSEGATLKFEYDFNDNTSIETASDKVFEEHDLLDTKKTIQVNFSFYDYPNKDMTFKLTHGNYSGNFSNEIRISSNDNVWPGYMQNLFNDKLAAVKPQTKHPKHPFALGYLSSIIPTLLLVYSICGIMEKQLNSMFSKTELTAIASIVSLIVFYIFFRLFNQLINLFPQIEFDFGPEHMKIEKNKKRRLWIQFTIFIFPICLTAISLIFF